MVEGSNLLQVPASAADHTCPTKADRNREEGEIPRPDTTEEILLPIICPGILS